MGRAGHEVRLIASRYVKPFIKRQKNDAADAEAIVEAVDPSAKCNGSSEPDFDVPAKLLSYERSRLRVITEPLSGTSYMPDSGGVGSSSSWLFGAVCQ
jgi:transposase